MSQSTWGRIGRRSAAVVVGLGCLLAAGCTSAPDPTTPAGPAPVSSSASAGAASTPAPLVVDITIKGTTVEPNGEKIDAVVGQPVTLNVTSDIDDEIHAHTGGDGYELEVRAGQTSTGSFTLTSAGSFEVESHHLEKVIVIVNAR